MADVLEAMGFPREWCERALRSTSGVEPAVELLLQWEADRGELPAAGNLPTWPLSSSPEPSVSVAAVSTVTTSVNPAAGLDAVVPDAVADEREQCPDAGMRLRKVSEQESEKTKARKRVLEDKTNGRWRSQLTAAPSVASGSQPRDSKSANLVELHIRCSGYPSMNGTFKAGATLREVRDFVLQELQGQTLQQTVGVSPSGGANRHSRKTSRSTGISAVLPSDRVAQRARKSSRNSHYTPSTLAPRNLASGSLYFLIPFPRAVFDSEASLETTLWEANLFPRGVLTVQFRSNEDASTSEQINIGSEYGGRLQGGVQSGHVAVLPTQSLGDPHVSRHVEDVQKREQRLKATLDRYYNSQDSQRRITGPVETGSSAAALLRPTLISTSAPSSSVSHSREERTLELDGERVRHRELALQAAAKRMSEAAQIFREGLPPNEGETGGGFCIPSDVQTGPPSTGNVEARFITGNQEAKGKQVADCGPSSRQSKPAEVRVQDVGSNIVGLGVRTSRTRIPRPSPSPSRPEKLQRTDQATSTSSSGANCNSTLVASGQSVGRAGRMGDVQEAAPSDWRQIGSSGSVGPQLSELRIRLEDGSVVRQTFPAYTTLQSVCEFAISGRFSTSDYGLALPIGSQFFEGEGLNSTLQEVGLVPRGVVHLQKLASRGLVTQGRRRARRIMRYRQNDIETEPELEQLWQDFSRHMNTNLTYEELVELEDSIGRVNVGVPESTVENLPTHTVAKSAGDICIVCLSEMMEGEEVMLLPCLHTFHPACIRQWLLRSTCCPTCKHSLT